MIMKSFKIALLMLSMVIAGLPAFSQKGKVVLNTKEVPEKTYVHLDNFPKDMVLPFIDGWGGLAVDINNSPAGTNFRPLLEGLKNDHCQVPHLGYVIKGAILIEYEDGGSDVYREGEVFYMRPGHTGEVVEDLNLVSFSPEEGMHDLSDHLENKIAEMSAK
jgi:hypothetical protein